MLDRGRDRVVYVQGKRKSRGKISKSIEKCIKEVIRLQNIIAIIKAKNIRY